MKVSIFGGSQPQPGSKSYADAYELGKLLAKRGHTIITGGYIGVMEAASKGAYEAGGHVVGVTCDAIEAWRNVKPNAWIKEERRFSTLQERLNDVIISSDAVIALPGGPGTLTEIALTWNLLAINSIPPRPFILIGEGWRLVISEFFNSFDEYIPQKQREHVRLSPDVHSAIHDLHTTITKQLTSLSARGNHGR